MKILDFLRSKVLRNTFWLIFGRVYNKALSFVVGIFCARYLGPGGYGLIDYAGAYISLFAAICNLGLNTVLVKDFVDTPENAGKTLGTTFVLRGISSLFSALMIFGIVSIADRGEPLTITVVCLCSIGILFQIFDSFSFWFQARLQSKFYVFAYSIAYTVISLYKWYLLYAQKSVQWFALATSLEYIIIAIVLFAAYRKNGGPKLSFSAEKGKELLSKGHGFILSGLMVSIYAATDKLMLKQMMDTSAVGYYGLAFSVSGIFAFVLSALIDSLSPGVMQSHKVGEAPFEKKNRLLYGAVFYSALLLSAVVCLFSRLIITVFYGEQYVPAIQPLRIVVWYIAFAYLGVARNAWIVCKDRQKHLKTIYFLAALLNVLLNFLLIPRFGPVGAAFASLVTQLSSTLLLPVFIRPLRHNVRLMLQAICLQDVLQYYKHKQMIKQSKSKEEN